MNNIGTLQERSLHAALKKWYARPGDEFEVKVDGAIIDIVRGDLLIEIQTRNFMGIKSKLNRLTHDHAVRLIYPIAREKWIVRLDADGITQLSRRKSPKRGRIEQLFMELVYIAGLVERTNLTLEVVFIREDEVWAQLKDGKRRAWRHGGWVRHDRRLIEVLEQRVLQAPDDFRALLPASLSHTFTNTDLAKALGQPRHLAERMSYSLRQMGVLENAGKNGRAMLFQRTGWREG
jgi:hypothetical protein